MRRKEKKNLDYLNKIIKINGYHDEEYYQYWNEIEFPHKINAPSYEKPYDNFKFLTIKYNVIVQKYLEKNFDYECNYFKIDETDRIFIYKKSDLN